MSTVDSLAGGAARLIAAAPVRVIFPSGMLGSGFPAESLPRGLALGATAIAIDAGSTDSGPYYLGAGIAKSSRAALKRDLDLLVCAAQGAGIPLLVGSCGTSGTDAGVDEAAEIVREIAAARGLSFRLACLYSEQSRGAVKEAVAAGRVRALPPAGPLEDATVESCEHIVGVMGQEPFAAALAAGAEVILAGRASDTAMVAALALREGVPPGPAWHAAKTIECGDQCSTSPRNAGVLAAIDGEGFTVVPLDPEAACTPTSVAAHMLYENSNPFRLIEPAGVLDTSAATYNALDERTVRVEGSRFDEAPPTIKLEGSAMCGYETFSFVGIVEPEVLVRVDDWAESLLAELGRRVQRLLGFGPDEYRVQIRCYGHDAILGSRERDHAVPSEVGVMLRVRASEQSVATAVAKTANPLLLHMPVANMDYMPSYAFVTSPAEIERGAVYEFALNHVVEVADPRELFRTEIVEVIGG